jgi:hypothetical protein
LVYRCIYTIEYWLQTYSTLASIYMHIFAIYILYGSYFSKSGPKALYLTHYKLTKASGNNDDVCIHVSYIRTQYSALHHMQTS